MGLHFIKNGTKHDVCVKRPSLFPASATTYDNSNSGLSATRVQGAIDEVVAKVDRGSVSVTADGTKTYGTLLDELFALADLDKVTFNALLVRGSQQSVTRVAYKKATEVCFSLANLNENNNTYEIDRIVLMSSGSTFYTNTNGTISTIHSMYASNGYKMTLYY